MKRNKQSAHDWLFALLLALIMMVGMSAAAFAEDGQVRNEGADPSTESNDVIWLNPNGDEQYIEIADEWTDVVLGVPTLDADAEMHFWVDGVVCAKATLVHMDGSFYDSGYNGFDLRDEGFKGENYYLHCSVTNGYSHMGYTVHYAVNDWMDNEPAARTVKGLQVQAKAKSAVVSWMQNNAAAGYAIQYGTNKKFKNAKKTEILKTSRNSMISMMLIGSLKSKKNYYFRIAPLTKDPATGATMQGKWSKKVKVKIR